MRDFVVAKSDLSGKGVFALHEVNKDHILFRYRGKMVESPTNSQYIFHNRVRNVYVDARDDDGNSLLAVGRDKQGRLLYEYVNVAPDNVAHPTIARYVNHLPSKLANCRLTAGGLVVAKRKIRRGEEITFSYGQQVPFLCKTKSKPLDL